jgi:hypothetical protein
LGSLRDSEYGKLVREESWQWSGCDLMAAGVLA